jgi:hypothetical protein
MICHPPQRLLYISDGVAVLTLLILACVWGRQLARWPGLGSVMLTNYDRRLLLAHTGLVRVSSKVLVDLGSHGKKRLVKLNESP